MGIDVRYVANRLILRRVNVVIGGFIVQKGEMAECMTIDLIYKNRNMTILVNGEDQQIVAIDPLPKGNIVTCELIKSSPVLIHYRITVPDEKVRIKNGTIVFEKEENA